MIVNFSNTTIDLGIVIYFPKEIFFYDFNDTFVLCKFLSVTSLEEKHKTKPQVQHVICSKFFGTVMYKIKLTNYH